MRPMGRRRFTKEQRDSIAVNLRMSIQAALGDRQALEYNLPLWNNAYEALPFENNFSPWKDSSNLHIPFAATQMDAFVAYIAATALGTPRFYLVHGITPEGQNASPQIERYYNAELMRYRRFTPTWHAQHVTWIRYGARDGMGTMECLWRKTKELQRIVTWNDVYDSVTGMPTLGPDGLPVRDKQISTIEVDGYNDAELNPRGLREIITIPANARSLQEAVTVVAVDYIYEDKAMEFVRAGVWDRDEVEAALQYAPNGSSELTSSQQPTSTYTAGHQISTGNAQGAQTSEYWHMRGPIEVYRCHTRAFDCDEDGQNEENIIWVHGKSWRTLGDPMRFEYWDQIRPFIDFSGLPRLENANGFSLIERTMFADEEISRIWNQRNNVTDRNTVPPIIRAPGVDIEDEDMAWGLNRVWEARPGDIAVLQMPPVEVASFEQEQSIKTYAQEFTGMSNPMLGMQNTGRRTAKEMAMIAAASNTRMNLIVMQYRIAARALINYIHRLNQQYKGNGGGALSLDQRSARFQIDPAMLTLDVQIDVAGASDPVDEAARRTEDMVFGETLLKFPWIANDPIKAWYVARMMGESFNRPDLEQMIGTLEEQQQMKQQMQTQQAVAAMAAQNEQPGQPPGQPPHQNGAPPSVAR
jgi:hypothetical protein